MRDNYKILLLSSLVLLSFSYIYDLPATLNEHINYSGNNKVSKLALLYSVYALPNIIIPLFFRFTNSANIPFISEILCLFVFLGQTLYSIGVYNLNYKFMVVGRLFFGLGGESFSILINRLLSKEFKSKGLAFTLGLVSSITRLGSILNFVTSPILAQKIHRFVPCAIGILLTLGSLISCLVLNKILKQQELSSFLLIEENKQNEKTLKTVKYTQNLQPSNENSLVLDYSEIFYSIDFNESPFTPWESADRDYTSLITKKLNNDTPKTLTTEENTIFYEPSLQKSKGVHSTFYILAIISFLISLIWAPFYSLAPLFFNVKYNINSVESGYLLSIIEIFGLIFTPFIGFLADKYGQKIYFILLGCSLLFLAHISFTLKLFTPYIIMSILGMAGPLVNCYWSCIPTLVSEKNLTNGFAIIFCLLNLAFTLSPFLMGFLMTKTGSLEYLETFIIGVSIAAMFITGLLIHLNFKFNLGLNKK